MKSLEASEAAMIPPATARSRSTAANAASTDSWGARWTRARAASARGGPPGKAPPPTGPRAGQVREVDRGREPRADRPDGRAGAATGPVSHDDRAVIAGAQTGPRQRLPCLERPVRARRRHGPSGARFEELDHVPPVPPVPLMPLMPPEPSTTTLPPHAPSATHAGRSQ